MNPRDKPELLQEYASCKKQNNAKGRWTKWQDAYMNRNYENFTEDKMEETLKVLNRVSPKVPKNEERVKMWNWEKEKKDDDVRLQVSVFKVNLNFRLSKKWIDKKNPHGDLEEQIIASLRQANSEAEGKSDKTPENQPEEVAKGTKEPVNDRSAATTQNGNDGVRATVKTRDVRDEKLQEPVKVENSINTTEQSKRRSEALNFFFNNPPSTVNRSPSQGP